MQAHRAASRCVPSHPIALRSQPSSLLARPRYLAEVLKLLRRKRDECEDKVVELVKGVMNLLESAQSSRSTDRDESNAQVERLALFRKELLEHMERGLGNAAQCVCTQVVKDAIGGCFKTTGGVHLARFPLLCSWAQQQLRPLVEQADR